MTSKDNQNNNTKPAILKTALVVTLFTFGAKILGYVRELILAGLYGTSYVVDAYIMSQTIPNLILAGILSAIVTAYIPLLSEKIEKHSEQEGNVFTSQVLNMLTIVSMFISILGIIFAEQVTTVLASGFIGETARLTSMFLRLTFAYIVFLSGSRILEAYLQYKGVFIPQVICGYVQNIIIIIAIFISVFQGVYFLAVGFLAGNAIYFLLVYVLSRKRGFKHQKPEISKWRKIGKEIYILAVPVFIGSEISVINAFVDKYLASGLMEGSVAALNYAYELQMLIISLTSSVFIGIIYPQLAQACSSNNRRIFCDIIERGTRIILIIAIPCMIGAILFCDPIVKVIYGRGAFDTMAVVMTGSAFAYYAIAIPFHALNILFTRIFYSLQDMRTPVKYGIVSMIINMLLNVILINYMQHNGLALATSIATICNTIMLYMCMRKKYPWVTIVSNKRKMFVIAGIAVGVVYISYEIFRFLVGLDVMYQWTCLLVAICICCLLYMLLLMFAKVEEVKILDQTIKRLLKVKKRED